MSSSLFNIGAVTLHAGGKSNFKIDCDFLAENDYVSLASLVSTRLQFCTVVGIPQGGLQFARALVPYCNPQSRNVLIVDDVLTTGTSFRQFRSLYERSPEWLQLLAEAKALGRPQINGVCIFSRNPHTEVSGWVSALFEMNDYRPE